MKEMKNILKTIDHARRLKTSSELEDRGVLINARHKKNMAKLKMTSSMSKRDPPKEASKGVQVEVT